MLYGYSPSSEDESQLFLVPVLSLTSEILHLKKVPEKVSISYGRTYFTRSETTIATVPIGYGDGYSRRLSNRTDVLVGGKRYPVVGTICMDQMMVDVGGNCRLSVGDEVTLIGTSGSERITARDIARRLGTIPYEILTGISERVPRVYHQ